MQNIERIIVGTVFVAILLNLSLIPLTFVLVVLALSSMACFYMYLSFPLLNAKSLAESLRASTWKEVGSKRAVLSLFAGIGFSMVAIGVLFRYSTWPNAEGLLFAGLTLLGVGALAALVALRNGDSSWLKKYFFRASAFGLAGVFMLLTPELMWFEIRNRDKPAYIEAFRKAHHDPDNLQYQVELERERERLIHE